jgi:hypothetical protein
LRFLHLVAEERQPQHLELPLEHGLVDVLLKRPLYDRKSIGITLDPPKLELELRSSSLGLRRSFDL